MAIQFIRAGNRRRDFSFVGNRLDDLFQNANDGCTNGIPIGPVVSDIVSELILSGVDKLVSESIDHDAVVVRFKDDYRILTKTDSAGRRVVKCLQAALKEYNLELNDSKTEQLLLPEGLFRPWVSRYHAVNPYPKQRYSYKRFKEVYLSVLEIDRQLPGTGIIDRFLADIVNKKGEVRIILDTRNLPKVISLLLLLARRRIKAFPKVLAIFEAIVATRSGIKFVDPIVEYLERLLGDLVQDEANNKYLIMWIVYFLHSRGLARPLTMPYKFRDRMLRGVSTSQATIFRDAKDFKLFTGVRKRSVQITMLGYLDVFHPQ
jgi:hypothetical protein